MTYLKVHLDLSKCHTTHVIMICKQIISELINGSFIYKFSRSPPKHIKLSITLLILRVEFFQNQEMELAFMDLHIKLLNMTLEKIFLHISNFFLLHVVNR